MNQAGDAAQAATISATSRNGSAEAQKAGTQRRARESIKAVHSIRENRNRGICLAWLAAAALLCPAVSHGQGPAGAIRV